MPVLPQSNFHLYILMGRDETLECADFMAPGSSSADLPPNTALTLVFLALEMVQPLDIHADMEKKLRM